MRKDITIAATPREGRGKNEARRLRVQGSIPAVLYGDPGQPEAIAVSPKELDKILSSKTGQNTIFNLGVSGGTPTPVMIIDWQTDPIKDRLLHADFKRIDLTKRVHVKVPVITQGDPRGVKIQGGLLELVAREVEIDCLPDDIPEQFTFDVSELSIGESIRVSDVPITGSMKLLSAEDIVIAHVVAPKADTDATEGTGTAEPEVIKKGKKEAEGAEAPKKK
jgi:large subunit ribosomal protein L25